MTQNVQEHKYFTFLSMLYVAISLCSLVIAQRVSFVFGSAIMSGSLIYPLTFVLSDILAEVYGYHRTAKIILFSFFLQFLFSIACLGIIHLPYPDFFHDNNAYQQVLGHLLRIFAGSFVAAIIGAFLNIYLLSKWKIFYRGRFFALRSLSSSFIGELVYTIISITIMSYNKYSLGVLAMLIFYSMLTKIIYNLLTILPATITVNLVKYAEKIDIIDEQNMHNPLNLNT